MRKIYKAMNLENKKKTMNYSLRTPDYYKKDIEAQRGNTSINQFIVNAIAGKLSALKTLDEIS